MLSNTELRLIGEGPRILRMHNLPDRIGLAPSTIYRLIAQGRFPKPFKICGGRAAGWRSEAIDAWLAEQHAGEAK